MAKVRDIIALIEADGWYVDRIRGSHRIFKHRVKLGTLVVPGHPGDDVPKGTERDILRKAGLI